MNYTQKFLRKRKFMTALPLLILPFMTLMFWAMGGGKTAAKADAQANKGGLNTELPDARLKTTPTDKLSLYDQALKDSLKLEEERKADPYSSPSSAELPDDERSKSELSQEEAPYSFRHRRPFANESNNDPNEQKIRQKLAELEQQLKAEPEPAATPQDDRDSSEMVDQLQQMMQELQQSQAGGGDQEMAQISGMLDKLLDIQHPGRVRERLRQESEQHKGVAYSLSTQPRKIRAQLLAPRAVEDTSYKDSTAPAPKRDNAFFDGSNIESRLKEQNRAIPAVVHETQELVAGATIKMRLTEDVYINGALIPKDNFVYGSCSLEGERLTIAIKNIRYENFLFPVALSVFDLDGLEGIRIPGAIGRDAAKQGMDQGIQSMDFSSMDPSLGAQAANAGIQTAKALFSRKARLVKAIVRADYPLLLIDQNQNKQ